MAPGCWRTTFGPASRRDPGHGLLCTSAFWPHTRPTGQVRRGAGELNRGGLVQDLEQKRFGATHELFSSFLLEIWGLPESMVRAVSRHHQSPAVILADGSADHLTRLTAAAG